MAGQSISEKELMQLFQQEQQNVSSKEMLVERILGLVKETAVAKEILEEMKKNKSGKMQISIGASVLVEVEAKEVTKCKRAFAEHGYVEENTEDTIKWLSEREENFKKQFEKAQEEYTTAHNRLTEIAGVLKQIEAEKKKLSSKQSPITISK
ncbi:MAG: hypothetical protein WCW44_06380 [archaeon]|jgi:prefoldin subunit 5